MTDKLTVCNDVPFRSFFCLFQINPNRFIAIIFFQTNVKHKSKHLIMIWTLKWNERRMPFSLASLFNYKDEYKLNLTCLCQNNQCYDYSVGQSLFWKRSSLSASSLFFHSCETNLSTKKNNCVHTKKKINESGHTEINIFSAMDKQETEIDLQTSFCFSPYN